MTFYRNQFFQIHITEHHFCQKQFFFKLFVNFSKVISSTFYYLYTTVKEAFKAYGSVQNFYQLPSFLPTAFPNEGEYFSCLFNLKKKNEISFLYFCMNTWKSKLSFG